MRTVKLKLTFLIMNITNYLTEKIKTLTKHLMCEYLSLLTQIVFLLT